ncbi:MAG: DUF1761 domain-containing protein [Candidatus Andersenbacteria bacterium]
MMFESVSIIAIIGGGIVSMIIGYVWYGPLFGKRWAQLQGWSMEDMRAKQSQNMAKSYGMMFVGSLVLATVLGMFARTVGALTLGDGAMLGLYAWLGFAAPLLLGTVLWEGKSWKLYGLNAGYYLVQFVVVGAIVTLWG